MGGRARGGVEEERAERARACSEEAAQERRNFEALQSMRCEGFRKVPPRCWGRILVSGRVAKSAVGRLMMGPRTASVLAMERRFLVKVCFVV